MSDGRPARRVALVSGIAAVLFAGGALLAASTTRPGNAAPLAASPGLPTSSPINPKAEAAAKTTPGAPGPSAHPWVAQTPADVLRNLPADPNFASVLAHLTGGVDPDPRAIGKTPTLAAPLFVRALRDGDRNEFLVPVHVGTTTIAILKVGVDSNGLGQFESARGWSSSESFPSISSVDALSRAGAPGDPAVRADLAWANLRGVADDLQPFWRVTRASGSVYYIFENGTLADASLVQIE